MPALTATPLIDVDQFRGDFKEFSDKTEYPDSSITFWLAFATLMLNASRWGNVLQVGVELFVAHFIVLDAIAADTAKVGGYPLETRGVIAGESPGSVNISYDTAPVVEENAGHWNQTLYGTRFIRIARMMGAGPMYIGPGLGCPGTVPGASDGGPAWSGPNCRPGQTTFGS